MTNETTIAQAVSAWRHRHELTQVAAAQALGVGVEALRHWESGRRGAPGPVARILQIYETLETLSPDLFHAVMRARLGAQWGRG